MIGSYEVKCNVQEIGELLAWFMVHRGENSVMLHPLTRHEVRDHENRSMWLGNPIPLDLSQLSVDLGEGNEST